MRSPEDDEAIVQTDWNVIPPSPSLYASSNVFALGGDGKVYASRMSGCDQPAVECSYRWAAWTPIGTTAVLTEPAVGSAAGWGLLHAYALAPDLSVLTNVQAQTNNHQSWSGWTGAW